MHETRHNDPVLPDAPDTFRVLRSYFRLPPEPGGMEQHIARLSQAQRDLGVDVMNVFNTGHAEGKGIQLVAGHDLLKVRPASLRNLIFYTAAWLRRRELIDPRPTVIHAHGDWSDFVLARGLAKAVDARTLAASVHGRVPPQREKVYKFALEGFDLVFCTGKAEQLTLEKVLGRPVYHLPSSPHPEFLAAPKSAAPFHYDVIGVANFFWEKAPEVFLECARLRPDLRFVLLGDGAMLPGVMRRVEQACIRNLELPGRKPIKDIISALRSARIFLSTSHREGTPTAALEAMAIGLPVILTPSNDYSWLVANKRNGYVTDGWQPGEIVARIDDVLEDEAARQAMGRRNIEVAALHTWETSAAQVTRLMAASIEARR